MLIGQLIEEIQEHGNLPHSSQDSPGLRRLEEDTLVPTSAMPY